MEQRSLYPSLLGFMPHAGRACLFTVRNEQVVPHLTVVAVYYLAVLVQCTTKGYHDVIRMVPSVFT